MPPAAGPDKMHANGLACMVAKAIQGVGEAVKPSALYKPIHCRLIPGTNSVGDARE